MTKHCLSLATCEGMIHHRPAKPVIRFIARERKHGLYWANNAKFATPPAELVGWENRSALIIS